MTKVYIIEVKQIITEKGYLQITADNEKEARRAVKSMPRGRLAYTKSIEYSTLKVDKITQSNDLKLPKEEGEWKRFTLFAMGRIMKEVI